MCDTDARYNDYHLIMHKSHSPIRRHSVSHVRKKKKEKNDSIWRKHIWFSHEFLWTHFLSLSPSVGHRLHI